LFQNTNGARARNERRQEINLGYKLPVPEWSKEMSFDAWKQNISTFKQQCQLNEIQKLTMILESLKKNKE